MQKENILALITRVYIQSTRLFSKDQQLLNPGSVFIYPPLSAVRSAFRRAFPDPEIQFLLCRFAGNYG